jgi:NAD(P)H-dependent flavin oxidoreductase YrpB (nitropropane dioxygenase family)
MQDSLLITRHVQKVPIAHTGRAGGVSGVRLRGDVSRAEKVKSDTLSVLILCFYVRHFVLK